MDDKNFENIDRNVTDSERKNEFEVSTAPENSYNEQAGAEPVNTGSYASAQNTVHQNGEPDTYKRNVGPYDYSGYAVPTQGMVKYDTYGKNSGSEMPQGDIYSAPVQEKKKSKGKLVACIAAALVLSLGVGVGGGFLGSYFANRNSVSTSESSNEESSNDKDGSVLKITQASDTEVAPTTIQDVVSKVKDSVVEITTETTTYDSFYGQYVQQSAGSGVIISEDGYIITNNHVIDGASEIEVRLTNEKTYEAKLIGRDSTLDVALLKIDEKGLTTAIFGNSAKLSVGQTAIVIGNPLGRLGGTVTDGIISALDREIQLDGKTMKLLQTNAAVNPGNSGGGLFDANGNLIGIIVAKSNSSSSGTSVEGLGFAIPVNDILDILEDLKTKGYVSGKAELGISYVDVTDQESMFRYRVDRLGVYVSSVNKNSAAEKAGIKIYDCITKVGDEEISNSTDLRSAISNHKAGDKVKVTVYRDGKTVELDVTLGEKASDETSNSEAESSSYSIYPGFGGGLF